MVGPSVMNKDQSSIFLTKIDLNDVTKQKPSSLVELRFAVIYKIRWSKLRKR